MKTRIYKWGEFTKYKWEFTLRLVDGSRHPSYLVIGLPFIGLLYYGLKYPLKHQYGFYLYDKTDLVLEWGGKSCRIYMPWSWKYLRTQDISAETTAKFLDTTVTYHTKVYVYSLRGFPLIKSYRKVLDMTFGKEVGPGQHTWKGGVLATLRNLIDDSIEQTLRAAEKEYDQSR